MDSPFVGSRCEVCKLPRQDRERVEEDLAAGLKPLSAIAASVGTSKTAIWRHAKNHLIARTRTELRRAAESLPNSEGEEFTDVTRELETLCDLRELRVRDQLVPLYKQAREYMNTAHNGKNWQAVKWFMGEARQLLELAGRANGEFVEAHQPGSQINVVVVMPRQDQLPASEQPLTIETTATEVG